jgi:integrase
MKPIKISEYRPGIFRYAIHRKGMSTYEYIPAGSTRRQAEWYARESEKRLLAERTEGIPYISPIQEAKGTLPEKDGKKMSEFIEKYLKWSASEKAPSTTTLERDCLKKFISFFGDIDIKSIDKAMAAEYKTRMLDEPDRRSRYVEKKLSTTSVNIFIRHMKAVLETAVEWDYIPSNPFHNVKQIKVPDTNIPKIFCKDAIQVLATFMPRKVVDFFWFCLYTGGRRGESCSLEWNQFDFKNNTVTFKRTKGKKSRIVHLNPFLVALLAKMDKSGIGPFQETPDYYTKSFKKAVRASGVDPTGYLHLHNLRHSFASYLAMAGVDIFGISQLLGHASVRTTQVYTHFMPDSMNDAVDRLQFTEK